MAYSPLTIDMKDSIATCGMRTRQIHSNTSTNYFLLTNTIQTTNDLQSLEEPYQIMNCSNIIAHRSSGVVSIIEQDVQVIYKRLSQNKLQQSKVAPDAINLISSPPLLVATRDEVKAVPGLSEKINFKQYSGYLRGHDPNNKLHYWFVESQNNPRKDPVLLWLNGGPGCSSLGGMISENGPFFLQDDGRTMKLNPYSWNKFANVLYLEAPVGVGYSYNTKTRMYPTGDDKTADDNYEVLQNFFLKYPQFSTNNFFISGESYGGKYVPLLVNRITNGKAEINLKGFAVGNGLLDDFMNGVSAAFYYYYHGFIDQNSMNKVVKACCSNSFDLSKCYSQSADCQNALYLDIGPVNPYNVYQDCPNPLGSRATSRRSGLMSIFKSINKMEIGMSSCMNVTVFAEYFNQQIVRKALHIDPQVKKWNLCNPISFKEEYPTIRQIVLSDVKSVRGLFYNGDFDTVCNFLGDEWFSESLKLPLLERKSPILIDGLTAGYKTVYENLTFVTVKGAGHMRQKSPSYDEQVGSYGHLYHLGRHLEFLKLLKGDNMSSSSF
ncbi:putative serine carboxypeptidase F41C3.5 [Nymphon striatum]|nr:putative serine carboxypeptidase F41C3.5 [Nymphon striatum]